MSSTGTHATFFHADHALSDDQAAVAEVFGAFFEQECPPQRVRDAEPLGFDRALWDRATATRIVAMGVPEAAGGDGASAVDLVLVAEQWGRRLAPIPFAEAAVAARLLAAAATLGSDRAAALVEEVAAGRCLATVALHPSRGDEIQLVPAAAVADVVVGLADDDLVVSSIDAGPPAVANQGHTPVAWYAPAARADVIVSGDEARRAYDEARREWRLLMAAALGGMADGALAIAIEHAKEREAFGVPIGSFQAVAHPLVDVATNTETSRRLTRKAAWWLDADREAQRQLVPMAYRYAEHAAVHAATVGVHTLGGVGFTVESDVQLYFRRAKGWSLVGGDPELVLDQIGDALFGAAAVAGKEVVR